MQAEQNGKECEGIMEQLKHLSTKMQEVTSLQLLKK